MKEKDQFRTRAYQKNLFCRHLTEVYSELPRPSHLKGFDGPIESVCFRSFRFVQFSTICKRVMRYKVVTKYIRKRPSIQNEKNWSQDRDLGESTLRFLQDAKERILQL